jgi:hypothetical protein
MRGFEFCQSTSPYLTVVDFPPVATPLPLYPYGVDAPLWEAAVIKGDHPIGFPNRSTTWLTNTLINGR